MSQLIDDLKASRAELERRGWAKSKLVREDGSVCMLGAIGCALLGEAETLSGRYARLAGDERAYAVIQALAANMPEARWLIQPDRPGVEQVYTTNDNPDTTLEDIYNFFDKALAQAGGLA
jgi:hypothetical protein